MNVSALYNNIPTQEGVDSCRSFLDQSLSTQQLDAFSDLMKIVLTHNNFTLNCSHYRNIFGTSMGTKMAPSIWIVYSWVAWKNVFSLHVRGSLSCGSDTLMIFSFFGPTVKMNFRTLLNSATDPTPPSNSPQNPHPRKYIS